MKHGIPAATSPRAVQGIREVHVPSPPSAASNVKACTKGVFQRDCRADNNVHRRKKKQRESTTIVPIVPMMAWFCVLW
jgi:hypothetical protein